jgi:hypothetical protein
MSYLAKAIRKLKPDSEFSFTNDDYSTVHWDVLEGKAPTQAQINAAIEQVKAEEIKALEEKQKSKSALLARLGLTEDELKTILG